MKVHIILATPALLLALHANAACPPLPVMPSPVVPDGGSATAKAMEVAQEKVQAYVSAIEGFLECRGKKLHTLVHNGMVIRAETAATDFNRELRKFRDLESEVAHN